MVKYNDPHKFASKLHGSPLTVLVDEVKEKPHNFKAYLVRSLYSTFTISF